MRLISALALLLIGALGVGAQTGPTYGGRVDAVALVSGQNQPSNIAVDADSVYWVGDQGSAIKKVSKSGGSPTTLFTGSYIDQLVADGESLFFTTLGEIRRLGKDGGAPATVVKSDLIGFQRLPLVVGRTDLYYFEEVGVPSGTRDKNPLLRKVSKSGGVPVTLSSKTYGPMGLATDGAYVYWADFYNGIVNKMSVNGGRAVTIGICIHPVEVAVDADSVYCNGNNRVERFKKPGRRLAKPPAFEKDYGTRRLVLDEGNIYALSSYKGVTGIYRLNMGREKPHLLVPMTFPFSSNFAVDDKYIYWTDERQGTVMRASK